MGGEGRSWGKGGVGEIGKEMAGVRYRKGWEREGMSDEG